MMENELRCVVNEMDIRRAVVTIFKSRPRSEERVFQTKIACRQAASERTFPAAHWPDGLHLRHPF